MLLSINDGLTLMIQGSDKKFRKVNIGFTFYRWTQKQLHINANIAVIFLTKSLNKPLLLYYLYKMINLIICKNKKKINAALNLIFSTLE